jgi:hypothetical protein
MITEFLRDKPPPHLLMLVALVVLLISQFFAYGDGNNAYMTFEPDFRGSSVWISFGLNGTGWELHPQAWVILVVLAFAFLRSDIYDHPLMQRFGWWAALALVVLCNTPSAGIRAFGSSLGMVAMLVALVAAIAHQVGRRTGARS